MTQYEFWSILIEIIFSVFAVHAHTIRTCPEYGIVDPNRIYSQYCGVSLGNNSEIYKKGVNNCWLSQEEDGGVVWIDCVIWVHDDCSVVVHELVLFHEIIWIGVDWFIHVSYPHKLPLKLSNSQLTCKVYWIDHTIKTNRIIK
jgi:hypothetical protein